MSLRFLERRYLQFRITLVAAVVCLIASGVMWFSGIMKGAEDPWIKWPFWAAVALFLFTIYDFVMPALEVMAAIKEHRYPSPDEQRAIDKEFYSGITGFVIGCVALLLVIYKLCTADAP